MKQKIIVFTKLGQHTEFEGDYRRLMAVYEEGWFRISEWSTTTHRWLTVYAVPTQDVKVVLSHEVSNNESIK